jgi:conjugal transfer/entry exclusion protein
MENIENIEALAKVLGLDLAELNSELKEEIDTQVSKVIKLFLAQKATEQYKKEIKIAREKFIETMRALGAVYGSQREEVYDEWYSFKLYDETFDVGF